MSSDDRLDELYREPPDRFVARRNELAKELRAGGERDAAERVKKLRRPSAAAWMLNRVAIDSPEPLEEFAAAARAVEEAQGRALEGVDGAAEAWRAAAARERDVAEGVVTAARQAAGEAGQRVAPRAVELLVETLHAAAADHELLESVLAGRLDRERSAATLGVSGLAAPPRRAGRPAESERRREEASARREREQLEAELDEARAREGRLGSRVEETTEALRREKAKLADAKRERQALARRLEAARRRGRK